MMDSSIMPCHQSDTDQSSPDNCNHCVLCHIAGAVVMSTLPVLTAPSHHAPLWSIDSISFRSFIPELPPRPPSLTGI